MTVAIDYFFSMNSPWAYLGHETFTAITRRHGATISYRPVRLVELFEQTGGLPLARRHEVRQRYRMFELQRWRMRRGVTLNLRPRVFPVDSADADRLVIGIVGTGGDPDPFMRRCFAALWAEERDIADPAVIADLATAAGVTPAALDRAANPETDTDYAENFTRARAAGVFGAPSYVVDGEVFWGQDRLELLDDMLASGRDAYRP